MPTRCSPAWRPTSTTEAEYWPIWSGLRSGFLTCGTMPKRRHHSCFCEQFDGALFVNVKDYGVFRCPSAQKCDEAVLTGGAFLHQAIGATNDKWVHDEILVNGCCRVRRRLRRPYRW